MATLIIVSSVCQFILAAKLSLFRKIFYAHGGGNRVDADSSHAGADHLSQVE